MTGFRRRTAMRHDGCNRQRNERDDEAQREAAGVALTPYCCWPVCKPDGGDEATETD